MSDNKIPFGEIGYITYKRTYARKLNENDSKTEEFEQTIDRVINSCRDQIKVGFTKEEEDRARHYMLSLKGSVAGRFLWQLGTKTVDKLGLASLQNCAVTVVDNPVRPFTWAFDMLMLGAGVGFNIQREHVYKLPKVLDKEVTITRSDTKDADFIVPDTREGWVKLLEKTLKAFFYTGKSFTYSTLMVRGKGVPIKSFGGTSSGPETLCWGIQEISKLLSERQGKQLRTIDCLDIMCIIAYIVVSGNVRRSALLALGDMDDLQYLNAKRWDLGNIPNWRAMSNNSVVCNDFDLLPEQFWQGYSGNGEPYGLINLKLSKSVGRIKDGKKYPDKKVICYNPCVTGDTLILTDNGYDRIDNNVNKLINIWNGFEWSEVTPKITGENQQILNLTFSDGRELKCTHYHKFNIIDNGVEKQIEAKDLKKGMKLIKHDFPIIEHGLYFKDAYTQGFISAEGEELNNRLYLYEPKYMCFNRLTNIKSFKDENKRKRIILNKTPLSKKWVPHQYNLKTKVEWLSGLFDGDATELTEGGLQIVSVDNKFLKETQDLLSTIGIQSKVINARNSGMKILPNGKGGKQEYYCQKTTRLCIGASQMQKLKHLGLKCERLSFDKLPNRDASRFITLVDKAEVGISELVYCFNEPKRHTAIFNGILTGQCAEQSLEDYESCCLSEIFLPNITSEDELKDVATTFYRINKHSLLLNCHHDETNEVVHRNLRMGIGVTGYLQATEEQRSWLSPTYEYLREFDKMYSKKLGCNESIKITTTKPSGTLSLLAGVTSGVHPAIYQYFIRRIRMSSDSPLVQVCRDNGYKVEYQRTFDGNNDHSTVVIEFPCSYPKGTILAENCSAIQQLEYVKELQTNWSDNAVSCTVYYKLEELESIKKWLSINFNKNIKTCSFLLHKDHGFEQAPYEEITEEQYLKLKSETKLITALDDEFEFLDSMECEGGACPIK